MNLELRKFDISSIGPDKVCVFIGKRETGKSFLVKDLLYYHKNLPLGTVISGTEGANKFYSKMVPSLFIHEEYSPLIVANALKRQKLVVKKMTREIEQYNKTNINPSAFFILDDCLYDSTWTKDSNIRSLFMNGRHYKMLFLITMQYALGVPPSLRTNIDFVFILRENYVSNRRKIYEHYAGMFPTFEIFCQVMDQCTEDFNCLVIHNNAKSNKLEDQVFWYKAASHSDFRIGAEEYWKHHSNNYNNGYDSEEDDLPFDLAYSNQKKKRTQINVKKGN
jgi:hypothetical protein